MALNVAVGNRADVTIPNCLISQASADNNYVLVQLPYDGTSVDSNGNKVYVEVWLPTDTRVTINQVAPPNWPPQENDVWIVPNVTPPAFVVADELGTLYFLTAATIRSEYQNKANRVPPTVNDALVQYGNKLTLLHRGNV